jgi:CDP-diacylglycerol--serine O-phosphatidyltransferase
MKKRVLLLPNLITSFGLALGLLIIFKTNLIDLGQNVEKFLKTSTFLLLLAAIADLLDGFIARAIKAESDFGTLFDSLSDAVTFGVAPSVLMLKTLTTRSPGPLSFFILTGAMLYSFCGVLRLVRYNVKTKKIDDKSPNKQFTGLPIPAAAGAVVSLNYFMVSHYVQNIFPITDEQRAIVLIVANVFIGTLMISKWKFPSLKAFQFHLDPFYLLFLVILLAIGFVYGVLYFFPILFFLLNWGYVLIGLGLTIARLIIGKKANTLKGFYPDEEDDE